MSPDDNDEKRAAESSQRPPLDFAKLPDEFTVEFLRHLSPNSFIELSRRRDELTDEQQKTLDAARAEITGPVANTIDKLNRISLASRSAVTPTSTSAALEQLAEQARLVSRNAEILGLDDLARKAASLSKATGVPRIDIVHAPSELPASAELTTADVEQQLGHNAEQIALLGTMVELTQQQVEGSRRLGWLTVVVSLLAVAAAVHPIINGTPIQAGRTILLSGAIAAVVFWPWYRDRLPWRRDDEPGESA